MDLEREDNQYLLMLELMMKYIKYTVEILNCFGGLVGTRTPNFGSKTNVISISPRDLNKLLLYTIIFFEFTKKN